MIQNAWYLILLICLSGCVPREFIIPDDEMAEDMQLAISVSSDPAYIGETIEVIVESDKPLMSAPTVIITQRYEKKNIDITRNMKAINQFTWQGTYTVNPGYEGKALVKVFNAIDEEGNKGYGTASFEVEKWEEVLGEEEVREEWEEEEEEGEGEEVEYEEVKWYDILGKYGVGHVSTSTKIGNNINNIIGDEEKLWFGTSYGIGQYDRLTNEWKGFLNKKGGLSNSIRCIAMDDDFVWFGSQGEGLFRYQNSTGKWIAFPEGNNYYGKNINDILIVDDLVFVATDIGLASYDKLLNQWIAYTLQTTANQLISEKITQITWSYPYLWIGTNKGLMSYDLLSDTWEDQRTICNRNVTCLVMDNNDLWIGTADRGIIQYNTIDNTTEAYTMSNGLYSNRVLSLTIDTGHVFVGHLNGISEFDTSNNTWSLFSQIRIGDIIRQLDLVQAVYLENNNTWIGMNTGLISTSQSKLMEIIKPSIIELSPANTVLSTAYPEITARYEDNIGGSGIDPLAVWLFVDGKQVYGTATAQGLYYKPISPLTEGRHKIEIQVADKCGNIATRKNTFSIALPLTSVVTTTIASTTTNNTSPSTPIVVIDKNSTSSWIIHGTATGAVIVELWGKQKLYNTTTPQDSGYFIFKTDPRRIPVDITTLYIVSVDNAGNRSSAQMLVSPPVIVSLAPADSIPTTTDTYIRAEEGGIITISGKLGQTTLKIPPDALVSDSYMTVANISENAGKLAVANFNIRHDKNIIPIHDNYLSLSVCEANGKPVSSTVQAMQLYIPYEDENHDGIVDETSARGATSICGVAPLAVKTLRIFKLNEASNRWEMVTDSYPVNTKCEVWANIYEFGIYAIMSCEQVHSLSAITVYPNPFYPDMDMDSKCTFSPLQPGPLTIYLYNSAGEQVRILHRYSTESIFWDGSNGYGDPVASGIYLYLIKNAKGKTTGKIGVIR